MITVLETVMLCAMPETPYSIFMTDNKFLNRREGEFVCNRAHQVIEEKPVKKVKQRRGARKNIDVKGLRFVAMTVVGVQDNRVSSNEDARV